MAEKLTKDERKALRQHEWKEEAKKAQQNTTFKKYSLWIGGLIIIAIAIIGMFWLVTGTSTTTSPNQPLKVASVASRDLAFGDKNSKAVLIEYADFECPACAEYHTVVDQIVQYYGNKILYVYRMFPLTQIHPNADISAQAAYAAYKQGKFLQYSNLLFNNQSQWAGLTNPTSNFLNYAKSMNLNLDKFKADMTSSDTINYVNASEQEALNEGLDHTPTFILNGNEITNPPTNFNDFKKLIDAKLAQK